MVASEPAEFISTSVARALLSDYCRHREAIENIGSVLDTFKPEWLKSAEGAKRYFELLKMREMETRAAVRMARSLRLTTQSRYMPNTAARPTCTPKIVKPGKRDERARAAEYPLDRKYCQVPEGKLVGEKIKLRAWQKKLFRGYDRPTRRAIITFGRKNGKTSLSACLLLLHLCGPEARSNSQAVQRSAEPRSGGTPVCAGGENGSHVARAERGCGHTGYGQAVILPRARDAVSGAVGRREHGLWPVTGVYRP